MPLLPSKLLEIWGGIECSINRVGETWFSQLEKNGHLLREDDLDKIKNLGITRLRYPLLWEHLAPKGPDKINWEWADQKMEWFKNKGITPIIGLLHHGSGPAYTSLLDPAFAQKLAEYAQAIAERYPWIEYFTPINEPLTTARFSGLYGLWYPHARSSQTFAPAFFHQIKGIVSAMKAIKKIIPQAKLIQTEDLGKAFAASNLHYQADFENDHRWLTFDLLTGKFGPWHKLWNYFLGLGLNDCELEYFIENFYSPEVLGINYYITSERYLDPHLEHYPPSMHGGNGQDTYVDIAAVRAQGLFGIENILQEVHQRYPTFKIAITEAHMGCTRDEQVRWLHEMYGACQSLHQKGLPIEAITIWSLLGSYNWNVLLTKDINAYEPGAFDVSSGSPRKTALAHYVQSIASAHPFEHEIVKAPGWWKRNISKDIPPKSLRPLLITGGTGTLGKAFARICELRNLSYCLLNRAQLDLSQPETMRSILQEIGPWAVINAAGYVRVEDAETEKELCMVANASGPANLALQCQELHLPFVSFSSDLVFDGTQRSPYLETHQPNPLNVYGLSKKEAEEQILECYPEALIIRTSAFFGPWDEYNFLTQTLRQVYQKQKVWASAENIVSPTYVPDLVNATLDLLIDQESGLWHLANPSEVSWAEFGKQAVKMAHMEDSFIIADGTSKAKIPRYSALGSQKGRLMPPLDNALERYLQECKPAFWAN